MAPFPLKLCCIFCVLGLCPLKCTFWGYFGMWCFQIARYMGQLGWLFPPPYFKQRLLKELKEAQCYVISFDESLNTELHEEQMDFLVRYFHKDKVTCRCIYLWISWSHSCRRSEDEVRRRYN